MRSSLLKPKTATQETMLLIKELKGIFKGYEVDFESEDTEMHVYVGTKDGECVWLTFAHENGTWWLGKPNEKPFTENLWDALLAHKWKPNGEVTQLSKQVSAMNPQGVVASAKTADDEDPILKTIHRLIMGYEVEDFKVTGALKTYPYQGGSLFRCYYFSNREQYDAFLAKSHKGHAIKGGGIWFKTKDLAAKVSGDARWTDKEEKFRGLMVEIIVDNPGEGIDLDLVGQVGLSEYKDRVWLKPDLYELRTERRVGDQAVDSTNADQVLTEMIQKADCDVADVVYVVHSVPNLSDAARKRAFNYLYRKLEFEITTRPSYDGKLEIYIETNVDNQTWNLYKYFDVWLPKDQENLLREMRTAIRGGDKRIMSILKKDKIDVANTNFVIYGSAQWLFHLAGETMKTVQQTIGARYHSLGEEGYNINKLNDPAQFRKALDEHTKKIVQLLENLTKTFPEKRS